MEVEIKAQVNNLDDIRKRLRKLGIKKVRSVHQMDEYFSLYKRPLRKVTGGDIVRVRYNHGERLGRLEYHSSKSLLASEELEVEVHDIRTLKKILKKMKAKPEAIVNKRREYYKKGRLEITLDHVKGLGTFVEVEIQGDDTKATRDKIVAMFKQLGIQKKQFRANLRYGAVAVGKKGKKYAYF